MKKKTYNIHSLGCKVNQYDSDKISAVLERSGFCLLDEGADFSIVYSCSVTESAMRKNRRVLNKVKRENPKAKIILAGCWPRVGEVVAVEQGVDLVIDKKNEKALLDFIFSSEESIDLSKHSSNITKQSRSRYFIKVQDGCEQFCSYCIIPYARGPLRSRSGPEITTEISKAIKAGYREIVLSGIHLGLYGHKTSFQLYDLLQVVIGLEGLGRVRLSSIELNEVNDYILELMKKEDKICNHLHVPLQSACDKILGLMNRPYDSSSFRKRVAKMRRLVPDIALSTDVIVGFPGETKKDYEETKRFIVETGFSKLHVFPFSAHKKTPAYSMTKQVEKKEITRRAKDLRDLGHKLESEYKAKWLGSELDAVLLSINGDRAKFMSEHFFEFSKSAKDFKKKEIGKIFKIKL